MLVILLFVEINSLLSEINTGSVKNNFIFNIKIIYPINYFLIIKSVNEYNVPFVDKNISLL